MVAIILREIIRSAAEERVFRPSAKEHMGRSWCGFRLYHVSYIPVPAIPADGRQLRRDPASEATLESRLRFAQDHLQVRADALWPSLPGPRAAQVSLDVCRRRRLSLAYRD